MEVTKLEEGIFKMHLACSGVNGVLKATLATAVSLAIWSCQDKDPTDERAKVGESESSDGDSSMDLEMKLHAEYRMRRGPANESGLELSQATAESHKKFKSVKFNYCSEQTRTVSGGSKPWKESYCGEVRLPPQCGTVADIVQRPEYISSLDQVTKFVNQFGVDLAQSDYVFDKEKQIFSAKLNLPGGKVETRTFTALKITSIRFHEPCDDLMPKVTELAAAGEATALKLTWNQEGTHPDFKGFRIVYGADGKAPESCGVTDEKYKTIDEGVIKKSLTARIVGLKENTSYGIRVCSVGVSTASEEGETRIFGEGTTLVTTTTPLPPNEVILYDVKVSPGKANAQLSWQPGANATGYIVATNSDGTLPEPGCAKATHLSNVTALSHTFVAPWDNNAEVSYLTRICSVRAGYANSAGVTLSFKLGWPTLKIDFVAPLKSYVGGLITVTGTGFMGLTALKLGSVVIAKPEYTIRNDGKMQAKFLVPAGAVSGNVSMVRNNLVVTGKVVNIGARVPMQVSAADFYSCGIADIGVKCWGWNYRGQTNVPILSNPSQVSAGIWHACAIDDYGVKCWGTSFNNQVLMVPALVKPKQISVGGNHACALDQIGIKCWGSNFNGETRVPSLSNPRQVSAGDNHTCAIDDSSVKCWGNNGEGQSVVPKLINPRQVSAGYNHTCAIHDNGVKCWGNNEEGQLNVPSLTNPTDVSAGAYYTCAIDVSGVKCWGNNGTFQLGSPKLSNPKQISAGAGHACAVDDSGINCWGDYFDGQTNVPSDFRL